MSRSHRRLLTRWYRNLYGIEGVLSALLVVVLVAYIARSAIMAPQRGARLCQTRYSLARTARDTAMVDEQMVGSKPGISCGFLRRTPAIHPRR